MIFPGADQVLLADLVYRLEAREASEIVGHLLLFQLSLQRGSFYGKIVVTIVSHSASTVGN